MIPRPLLDLLLSPIRMSVVVVAIAIAFVQPLLVLALELVIQDNAFDVCTVFDEAVRNAEVRLVNLRVVFGLALAFEARVELLVAILVTVPIGLWHVATSLRQHHGHVAMPR